LSEIVFLPETGCGHLPEKTENIELSHPHFEVMIFYFRDFGIDVAKYQ